MGKFVIDAVEGRTCADMLCYWNVPYPTLLLEYMPTFVGDAIMGDIVLMHLLKVGLLVLVITLTWWCLVDRDVSNPVMLWRCITICSSFNWCLFNSLHCHCDAGGRVMWALCDCLEVPLVVLLLVCWYYNSGTICSMYDGLVEEGDAVIVGRCCYSIWPVFRECYDGDELLFNSCCELFLIRWVLKKIALWKIVV